MKGNTNKILGTSVVEGGWKGVGRALEMGLEGGWKRFGRGWKPLWFETFWSFSVISFFFQLQNKQVTLNLGIIFSYLVVKF
jgi:hypothetical protein